MTNIDPNEFLKGGSKVPSAKFDAVGDHIVGDVVGVDVGQARKFGSNDLDTWDDGRPKMNLIVTLQTELRDPNVEGDDGRRRIFALQPSEMLRAIAAVTVEDGKQLAIGGRLAVQWIGERPHEKAGFNPVKLYKAAYSAPTANAAADLLAGAAQPAEAPAPTASAPSVDSLV